MLYKSLKSEVVDLDIKKGIVEVGVNAFNNEDSHHDISMAGSYTKTLRENFDRLKWHLNHDRTLLLGATLEAKETATHLVTVGQLNLNKQVGRDTYEDYKLHAEHGRNLEHSVGVKPIKRDLIDKRKVSEWFLGEWSTLTTWGSNPNTEVFSVKSELESPEKLIEWLELSCRKGNYSDLKGKQLEAKILELKALIENEPPIVEEPGLPTQITPIANTRKLNALNDLLTKLTT